MVDGIVWEENNYYCNNGSNKHNYGYQNDKDIHFCHMCYLQNGGTEQIGAREALFYYWTVVIANLHHRK